MMEKIAPPWSVPVAVDEIPETGLHREIEAPASVLAAIAKLASVREVSRLSAAFDLTRTGAGARVEGTVRATVGQTCVVSLEPMETDVEEAIDLRFAPKTAAETAAAAAEGHYAETGEEPPEPLLHGRIDLGAIATEFLVLGIDPYPRKPGAEFAAPKVEDGGENPFTALEALKKWPGGGQP
jgi:uncharacterized metal-binding protein YceD (DUF177 family)